MGPALPPTLAWKQKGPEEKERRSSDLGLGGEVRGPSRSHESPDTFTPVSGPAWPPPQPCRRGHCLCALAGGGSPGLEGSSLRPPLLIQLEASSHPFHWLVCFCCCSVAQSCPTLCDPTGCSTPGLLVLHHLPEFAQTHVHQACDTIQPSHPLPSLLLLPSI